MARRAKGSSSSRGAGTAPRSPLGHLWHSPAFEAATIAADAGERTEDLVCSFSKALFLLTAELESNPTVR